MDSIGNVSILRMNVKLFMGVHIVLLYVKTTVWQFYIAEEKWLRLTHIKLWLLQIIRSRVHRLYTTNTILSLYQCKMCALFWLQYKMNKNQHRIACYKWVCTTLQNKDGKTMNEPKVISSNFNAIINYFLFPFY